MKGGFERSTPVASCFSASCMIPAPCSRGEEDLRLHLTALSRIAHAAAADAEQCQTSLLLLESHVQDDESVARQAMQAANAASLATAEIATAAAEHPDWPWLQQLATEVNSAMLNAKAAAQQVREKMGLQNDKEVCLEQV